MTERLEKIVRDNERRAAKRAAKRAVEKERRIAKRNTERAIEKERRHCIKCLLNKGMDLDDILNIFGITENDKKKYHDMLYKIDI